MITITRTLEVDNTTTRYLQKNTLSGVREHGVVLLEFRQRVVTLHNVVIHVADHRLHQVFLSPIAQ